MATVTVDDMRSKLISIEQVQTELSKTEPITSDNINSETKILFKFDPEWTDSLDAIPGTAGVDAIMRINGSDHQMTKEAALQAAANFGITGALVKRLPSDLLEKNLNYFYSTGFGVNGAKDYNVLSVQDRVSAFTRSTVVPFSNLALLENAIAGIRSNYGKDAEILADYKFSNSLMQTDIRLIIPESSRDIKDSHMNDVLDGNDRWSAGLHLSNSLIGKTQTSLEAYLFRWWCTNGCTTQLADAGVWSRRSDGQQEDVYEWARNAVDDVLGGLEGRFDQIQALTGLNVAGNTNDIVSEIFSRYNVPTSQRTAITENLLESETLTMYSIMNAITQVANDSTLSPARADKLMRIGGDIPTSVFDTIKAKVWQEGHLADPEQNNPYIIGSAV